MEKYLRAAPAIDCDHEAIIEKAAQLTNGRDDVIGKAKSLFYFVRDEIRYNIYVLKDDFKEYKASATLARGEGFCIQKAIVLAALARAAGIPSRLRFAIIRNPLASEKVKKLMRGDLFVSHGYDELFINGRWIKAAPTFDRILSRKNNLVLVEFDGVNDALLPAHDLDGRPHIEYVLDRGDYDDLPFDEVIDWRRQGYGSDYAERFQREREARNTGI